MALDLIVRHSADADAMEFCKRSGATDRAAINAFVRGAKQLGLWNSMVCWPLRSTQNAGTGTTAYSLGGLGTYNGTLVNGPTWGADGVDFSQNSSEHILTALTPSNSVDQFVFAAFECNAQGTGSNFNVVASSRNSVSPTGGWTGAQEWTGGFGTLLWADGGSLNLLGINQITDGSYNSALWRYTLSSSPQTLGIIVNALSEQTVTGAKSQGSSNPIVLGNETPTSTRSLGGNLSFVAYITASSVDNSALRDLYRQTLGTGLGLPDYDPATIEYANRSGATDLANIDAFVRGVKDLGLWENMVCWPLRSSQNAGTGTTAYSLGGLGTYDGTLVNTPAWGADGMTFDNALTQYISTAFNFDPATGSTGFATIVKPTDAYPTADLREICGNRQTAASALYKLTGGQQDITLFDSAAGHNTATATSRIGTTFSNTRHFAGGFTDSSTRQFFNQADALTATATSTGGTITSGSHAFEIGRAGTYGTARTWTGEISVVTLIRRTTITEQDIESLRTLYKSTLGTGLGLP